MIWHILKYLLSFSIPSFYRKIQIKNAHYLKTCCPVIIVSNHPNAFMDPIVFSYMVYPPRIRYMARGDAFREGIISNILQSIGIVPIYRMQDAGIEGLKKNNESYKVVYKLLQQNKKIMIFAEGICVQEKRLRPIKKGVPRLIYTAQQHISHKDILILPVCLNYESPSQIGSRLFIYVGEPFCVKDRMMAYEQNPNQTMLQMMNELYQKMLPLIVHVEQPEHDVVFEETRAVLSDYLCQEKKLQINNLEHIFMIEKEIADTINYVSSHQTEKFVSFKEKIHSLYQQIQKENIDLHTILSYQNKRRWVLLWWAAGYALLYIPYSAVYHLSLALMYVPYYLSHYLAKKSSTSIEFYASFFLAYSTFIFLGYYLILFFGLNSYIHPLLLFFLIMAHLSFIPLIHYYSIFKKRFFTILKIVKNKTFALDLSKNIHQIFLEYENFKNEV